MTQSDRISLDELRILSWERLVDVAILLREKRYDAAYYLCGYTVELVLKRRICLTLGWSGYPKKKFDNLSSYKTHDLPVLLHLSGIEEKIKRDSLTAWSIVRVWNPEVRYSAQSIDAKTAEDMLNSTRALLETL